MNPPSDTPRTDALNEALLADPSASGERAAHAFYKHAKVLERELSILKSKREAAVRYGADSLESDSIENSCNCLERTPEAHLHKPGCKYRLISERDEARKELERLNMWKEMMEPHPVEVEMKKECDRLRAALQRIEKWFDEFPSSGRSWKEDGSPMSYGAAFGSNGERDYMRQIAREALTNK